MELQIWILRMTKCFKNFKQESDMIRFFIIEKPLFCSRIEDRLGESSGGHLLVSRPALPFFKHVPSLML